jgi:nicotinamidase-related amidase
VSPVLILIDVQKGFDDPSWGRRNNPDADQNIEKLLTTFRKHKLPVIHIQHMSTEPQSTLRPHQVGNEFKAYAVPQLGEAVFQKTVNSAFIGTNLENHLKDLGSPTLIIAGITTNHCVSTTTRMAGNLGFSVFVSSDATHAFDFKSIEGKLLPAALMHEVGLAELNHEFATILSTTDILELTCPKLIEEIS